MKTWTKLLATSALAVALALPAASASAADYKIDDTHAFVIFKVDHLGVAPSYGMFRKIEGTFSYDDAKPEASKVSVTIDAGSIFTANKKRDEHLQGPDFFDAKQFPAIVFASKSIKKAGNGLEVTGDLTIKGRTKSVTLNLKKTGEGKDPWGNFRTGFEGSVRIDRMDFGVDYMPDGIGKSVELMLSLEGIRQ